MQEYISYKSDDRKRRKATRITCNFCSNTKLFDNRKLPQEYICDECKELANTAYCAHCGNKLVRPKSKRNSDLVFCNRNCKEAEQCVGGKMQLSHYGSDKAYRKKALRILGHKCKLCDITEDYLLVVHHIDKDRSNNNISNLEVLCHNHHAFRHRVWNGKKWVVDYNGLD